MHRHAPTHTHTNHPDRVEYFGYSIYFSLTTTLFLQTNLPKPWYQQKRQPSLAESVNVCEQVLNIHHLFLHPLPHPCCPNGYWCTFGADPAMTAWIVFLGLVTSQLVNGVLELETLESLESSVVALRNGREIPVMGLRAPPELLGWAFRLGYRMTEINHRSASEALRESQLPRSALFVSTQLSSHGFDEAHRAIRHSLRQLRLDYVDLLLLASPWEGKLIETWDAMVEMNKMGLVRSLAVRDFDIHHLETLASHGRPLPEVLQLELHPLNFQKRTELIQWCKDHQIQIQATGSLSALAAMSSSSLTLSQEMGMSAAQILLRWALQMGFQIMPKSSRKEHIEENFQVLADTGFQLTPEEMRQISDLEGNVGLHTLDAPLHLGDTTRKNRSDARVKFELSAELWAQSSFISEASWPAVHFKKTNEGRLRQAEAGWGRLRSAEVGGGLRPSVGLFISLYVARKLEGLISV